MNTYCVSRHPLQELCVPVFIENDSFIQGGPGECDDLESVEGNRTDIPENSPSLLLLTGPNFSGKSVYLKQVINSIPALRFSLTFIRLQ